MALLSVLSESDGLEDTDFVQCTSTDRFLNDGETAPWFKNTTGANAFVNFAAQTRDSHGFLNPHMITVAAGETLKGQTLEPKRFNNASGEVVMTYSPSTPTGVSVAVVRQENYA